MVQVIKYITRKEGREMVRNGNFKHLVGWTGFDAYGDYYVDIDNKLCVFIHYNDRANTDCSALYQFSDLNELANFIWEEEKGTLPFRRIAKAVKEVFGVDVKMSASARLEALIFGEAK
jgi:hypothetical protein